MHAVLPSTGSLAAFTAHSHTNMSKIRCALDGARLIFDRMHSTDMGMQESAHMHSNCCNT